jgi:hypothetical protein
MPTVAELIALDYEQSPAQAGLSAEEYRTQYEAHGLTFRFLAAIKAPSGWSGVGKDGMIYNEQSLASTVRCMVYQTSRDFYDAEQNILYPRGSTGISTMPDEVQFARYDRIILTAAKWFTREIVTRAASGNDALNHPYPHSIVRVRINNTVQATTRYQMTSGAVQWLNNAPATGTNYAVEYLYHPVYEFLGNEQGVVQQGSDGLFLPQRGVFRQVTP